MTHEGEPLQLELPIPAEKAVDSAEAHFFKNQWDKYTIATGMGITGFVTHGGSVESGIIYFVGGLVGTEIWSNLIEPHLPHDQKAEAQKEQK